MADSSDPVISAGATHSLIICSEGYLYVWGAKAPTLFSSSVPVRIGDLNNWTFVAAGVDTSFAINSDGHLYAWGRKSYRDARQNLQTLFLSDVPVRIDLNASPSGWNTHASPDALPALVFISGTYNTQRGWRYSFDGQGGTSFPETCTITAAGPFAALLENEKGNLRNHVGRIYKIPSAQNHVRTSATDSTMNSRGTIRHNAESINRFMSHLAADGVTDVIFIGYSKGGLDVRHYLDTLHESADHDINVLGVLQLGSPNLGTPAADFANAGNFAIGKLGGPVAGVVTEFFGPGCSATRDMSAFIAPSWNDNRENTLDIPIHSFGGAYFFDQSSSDISDASFFGGGRTRAFASEQLMRLMFATRTNDGTVHIESVIGDWRGNDIPNRASGVTRSLPVKHAHTAWHSWGALERGATITGQNGRGIDGHSAEDARNLLVEFVGIIAQSSEGSATSHTAIGPLAAQASFEDEAIDNHVPMSHSALVEEISVSSGTSPKTREIALTGETALIASDNENISFALECEEGISMDLYFEDGLWFVFDLEPGTHTLQIASDSTTEANISVLDLSDWGMRFDAPIDGRAGQQITVRASFEELDSDNVGQIESASVSLDGQAPVNLSINNGIAAGKITLPNTSELSMITGTATGTTSCGKEITRVFGHQIAIAPAAASLRGDASIYAQAGDSSAYESVELSVGITGNQSTTIAIEADIVDSAGVLVAQPSTEVEVSAGFSEEVILSADSQMIWQNMSTDGALTVSEVRVFYLHDDFTKLIDSAQDVATSAPISRADFAASGITITPLEDELFAGAIDFSGTAFTTAGNLSGVEVSFSGGDSWYSANLDDDTWSFTALLDEGTFGMHARPVIDGSPVESPRLWASTVFEVVERPQPPDPTFHTITFNSQGGSAAESLTVEDGQEIGTLPTTTKEGYTFLGWFDAPSAGNQITISTLVTGSVTYYAQWQRILPTQHTVVFNTHGGTPTPASRQIQQGSPMGALPTVTRANHTFAGWWTAQSGGTQITATTPVNANMTVHARWAPILPTRVTIGNAQSSTPLLVGRNRTLTANVTPTTALNRNVTWTSSNTRVATINANGRVTARAPGTTTIRVRTAAGDQTATATIRVQAAPAAINSSVRNITLRQNTNFRLPVVVRGNTNTNVTVNWRTNNRNVATLSNNRTNGSLTIRQNANRDLVIRAGRPGTARIRLTTLNNRTITYNIRVVRNTNRLTQVRIGNLPRNNTMNVGANRNLTTRLTPARATLTGNIRWSSSNRRVATVNNAGRVTAHRRGETTITMRVSGQVHRVVIRVR